MYAIFILLLPLETAGVTRHAGGRCLLLSLPAPVTELVPSTYTRVDETQAGQVVCIQHVPGINDEWFLHGRPDSSGQSSRPTTRGPTVTKSGFTGVPFPDDPYEVANGSDALVITTDWP